MTDSFDYAVFGLQAPTHKVEPPVGPRDLSTILSIAADEQGNAEALVDPDKRYNFQELLYAVNCAASLLQSKGLKQGDRIAASVGNRCDVVIGFFAAMQLGAIWVGINRILPPKEKQYILKHSCAAIMLTDNDLLGEIDALRGELPDLQDVISVESDLWQNYLAKPSAPNVEWPDIDPYAPAAIMYTSGTTGLPKGVVHSQHNMVTIIAAASANGLMSPTARRGAVLPVTITNVMILGPAFAFWNKKSFVCGQSPKIEAMVEWIKQENISNVATVPTMVYDLLKSDLDLPENFKMGCGGAPLPESVRKAFLERHGFHIQQSYGLTEAPTVVAESRYLEPPLGASGLALPHLTVSIRDKDGNNLPNGTIGEVCISAATTGEWANVYAPPLGYWRDSEKTAALLAGGVVHTSDLGSLDENGWLSLADRSSELILRGGSNVYPAEIERVLHGSETVADCAVVGKPDERMGMRTVAFIQPTNSGEDPQLLILELENLCRENLVRYKIPDEWIIQQELPRNAMGKIIKPKLRELLEIK